MAIDTASMNQIISDVFEEMLGLTTAENDSSPHMSGSRRITASIRITGAIEQLVVVEAPVQTAGTIAETMFDTEAETLEEEEIRDAIGEVVNMIGGNVKGACEGNSSLSIPCVSEAIDESSGCPAEGEYVALNVEGRPLLVHWRDMAATTV